MVQEMLNAYIADNLLEGTQRDPIAPEENLLMSGMIDSIGIIQLVNFIEEEYGFKVEAGEVTIDNFKTIETITDFITLKRAGSRK